MSVFNVVGVDVDVDVVVVVVVNTHTHTLSLLHTYTHVQVVGSDKSIVRVMPNTPCLVRRPSVILIDIHPLITPLFLHSAMLYNSFD